MRSSKMRLGVLPVLAAVPLFLAACGDDEPSDGNPFFAETKTETKTETETVTEEAGGLVFDNAALEGPDGIQSILVNEYGMENIESVTCPADQEVKTGNKFECTVEQGGDDPKELTVEITITSDDGEYQVGLPEESK
jgi:hypothetical protein